MFMVATRALSSSASASSFVVNMCRMRGHATLLCRSYRPPSSTMCGVVGSNASDGGRWCPARVLLIMRPRARNASTQEHANIHARHPRPRRPPHTRIAALYTALVYLASHHRRAAALRECRYLLTPAAKVNSAAPFRAIGTHKVLRL